MLAKYIRFDSKLDSKIENVRVKIGIADLGYSPVHVAYIARDIPKSLSGIYSARNLGKTVGVVRPILILRDFLYKMKL